MPSPFQEYPRPMQIINTLSKLTNKNTLLNFLGGASFIFLLLFGYDYYGLVVSYGNLSYFDSTPIGGDYLNFWAAGWLTAHGNPLGAYTPKDLTAVMASVMHIPEYVRLPPFYYPPTYLLFIAPFGLLPFFASHIVYYLVSLVLLLLTIQLWTRDWRITSLSLLFFQIPFNLIAGQNALYTASFFGLAMYAVARHRPLGVGVALGLLSIKPQLGLLIPFALLGGREWRAFLAAAGGVTGMILLSCLLFGGAIWVDGLSAMANASTILGSADKMLFLMTSLFAYLRSTGLDTWFRHYLFNGALTPAGVAMTIQLCLSFVVMLGVVWVWWVSRNPRLRTAALACGSMLFTPFIYGYDLVWMIWPILLLGMEGSRTRWTKAELFFLPACMIWSLMFSMRLNLPFPHYFVPPGFSVVLVLFVMTLFRTWMERKGRFPALSELHPPASHRSADDPPLASTPRNALNPQV